MDNNFQVLISSFQSTIFTRNFYCDFEKIRQNAFSIKIQLNILNSLLGEKDIDSKFIEIITKYPETREVLPILLAVRKKFSLVLDSKTKEVSNVLYLFDKNTTITKDGEDNLLKFFDESGLKKVFENKNISDLNDYVFGIETGLDSNARKNRSGTLMESLVGSFIKDFCQSKSFQYKDQATAKRMIDNRGIKVESDKSDRRFDFAIYNGKKVFLIETNFYGGGGSKLKAVAGEFSNLYNFLGNQQIPLIWITDGAGRQTTLKSLEEAYNATNGNIFNLQSLKNGILEEIIK
ncbi:MAG: type II restriction endonuclease [Candidatus Absconditabacterales bacterium]|nr:type II restriction endonuclease [Candidatus Absconditabacterales bacterium]